MTGMTSQLVVTDSPVRVGNYKSMVAAAAVHTMGMGPSGTRPTRRQKRTAQGSYKLTAEQRDKKRSKRKTAKQSRKRNR